MNKETLKKIVLLLMTAFLVAGMALSAIAEASGDRAKQARMRVLFPEQSGLSYIDENGKPSGYMYDYLMRIAQRTGWKYEFVTCGSSNEEIQDGLERLKKGEIDLASLVYTDELARDYAFCTVPYGEVSYSLVALRANKAVNSRTLQKLTGLKIALVEKATLQNSYFDSYAQSCRLNYEIIYGEDNQACYEMLRDGRADLIISEDAGACPDVRAVASLYTQPLLLAAAKENPQLAQAIDEALKAINLTSPYFKTDLQRKHFFKEKDQNLSLTAEEQSYIQSAAALRAVVLKGDMPIQAYDQDTLEYRGIVVDILREMALRTGLRLEFIAVEHLDEAAEYLAQGKADMIAGLPYDYDIAEEYNVLLTSPIFTIPVVCIMNKANTGKFSDVLVPDGMRIFDGEENIKKVNTLARIFTLVNAGEFKIGYVNGYIAHHYAETHMLNNVVLSPTPFKKYDLCIGVSRDLDLRVISILEQAIANIPASVIENIVYENTSHIHQTGLLAAFYDNPIQVTLFFSAVLVIIILLLLLLFARTKQINRMISEEKNQYKVISDTDRMTQTYNNSAFKRIVREYLTQTDIMPQGALLVLDIDNFKKINDTYGHLVGDEIIAKLGGLLNQLANENDVVGRLGGDEFVILARGVVDRSVIEKRSEQLLQRTRTISDKCAISISIGIAVFRGSTSFDDLFKIADDALYNVKSGGKDGAEIVCICTD